MKRIFYALITLIVLMTILFFLMQLIPGFPIHKALNETEDGILKNIKESFIITSKKVSKEKMVLEEVR